MQRWCGHRKDAEKCLRRRDHNETVP
jgi:hypothetical protein